MSDSAATASVCPVCGTPGGKHFTHVCMTAGVPSHRPMHSGWVCPKCGRVYSPLTLDCRACNLPIEASIGVMPRGVRVIPDA